MTNVILIPGSAVVQKTGRIDPDQRYKSRLLSALELYEPGSVIVLSGAVYNPTEAEVGRNYLSRKGIPEDDIVTRNDARDTYENAREFREAIERIKDPEVHLITNGFHSLRALLACELFGIKPEVHTTEEVLRDRYSGLKVSTNNVIRNASEIKPGEQNANLIGLVAACVDYVMSLSGRIRLHPTNHVIARVLGYDQRVPQNPPDFEHWDTEKYPPYSTN